MPRLKKVEFPKSSDKKLSKDYEIAYDFAGKVYQKFRDIIKAIILFGSVPKKESTPKSDLDIIIIIDDCTVNWDDELIAWYREELYKLLASQKYDKEIHINTVTITAFWEEIRAGEPLVINILRYGEALIDLGGFFDPLKVLLAKGRIRPSAEAIFTTMERSGKHLGRANISLLNSVEGFYWGMVDSAHSLLMAYGIIPPSPEKISDLLSENFISKGIINKDYLVDFEFVRGKAKDILHGAIIKLSGKEIEDIQRRSEDFVKKMIDLANAAIKDEKIVKVNYKEV